MAASITVTSVDNTQNSLVVFGTIALSGNYGGGATHGDTLSFAGQELIKSFSVPLSVRIFEAPAAGASASGYVWSFSPGSTIANGVLQAFTSNGAAPAALLEYPQGTGYQASQTNAALKFEAWFPSFV